MKRLLVGLLLLVGASFGQALSLNGSPVVRTGSTITINLWLTAAPPDLAGLQWSLAMPSGYTATAVEGPASIAAGKSLFCNTDYTLCLAVGMNTNLYADGIVAVYQITIPETGPAGVVGLTLSGLLGVTTAADAVQIGGAGVYQFVALGPPRLLSIQTL